MSDDDDDLHLGCRECLKELPDGQSMADYGRTIATVSKRRKSIVVTCLRHDLKLCEIDDVVKFLSGLKCALCESGVQHKHVH